MPAISLATRSEGSLGRVARDLLNSESILVRISAGRTGGSRCADRRGFRRSPFRVGDGASSIFGLTDSVRSESAIQGICD